MTTPIESTRREDTRAVSGIRHRAWWRGALVAGLIFAGAVVAILLGVHGAGAVASAAGFVTAITVIAATVISWEHGVVNARTDGLIESGPGHPSPRTLV
ncbi:hypothetical protein ACWDTP_36035 [Mycobacterium sp. NPDC003449]